MKKVEKESREIFDKLHVGQAKDSRIFKRLTSLLSTEYLKVPKHFFKGKVCLDAGCGSNANAAYAMLQMGAKKVCAFDLDKSIFKTAPRMLKPFEGRYELKVGNVHTIPYPDASFDFVHCAGVLHHSTDIYKGLKELCRVTKKGGMLHVSVNGTGGIMRDFSNVLRNKYTSDPAFKKLLNNVTAEDLVALWDWVATSMRAHGDKPGLAREDAKHLFNEDLILTIKDRVQAPLYLETTEMELRKFLAKQGFSHIERLKMYPKQHNIRRYLAPFYFDYEHPVSKMLYGDGIPRLKAVKR